MIALLLLACYTEAQFQADFDQGVCEWKAECDPEGEIVAETCEEEAAAAYESPAADCTFSPDDALACADGVQNLPCPSELDEDEEVEFPAACDRVWECG